jgi:hypothetical protein
MGANGKRRPARPRIEISAPTASPAEAAAIAAALEQVLADTAPGPTPSPAVSRWQAAALREGVEARRHVGADWGASGGWHST